MKDSDCESFRAQHKSLVSMEDCCLNPEQVVQSLMAGGECYAGQSNRRYTCFGVRDVQLFASGGLQRSGGVYKSFRRPPAEGIALSQSSV